MWILPLVGYLGMILGFGFLTLAIGKCSLYLSALVPPPSVSAGERQGKAREAYATHSLGALLPLGTRGGAHGAGEEAAHAHDIRHMCGSRAARAVRWLSVVAEPAGYWQPCGVSWEPEEVSDREAERSAVCCELW